MSHAPTGNQDRKNPVDLAERQAQALHYRKQGWTFAEIADELGYANAGGAHKAVMAALRKLLQEPGDEVRRLEIERVDLIIRSLMPFVLNGSPRHAEVVLKAMDRRALYLGLDRKAPTEDHRTVTIRLVAEQIAASTGLSADEVLAEATAILKTAAEGAG